MKKLKLHHYFLISIAVILLDQVVKLGVFFWIKDSFGCELQPEFCPNRATINLIGDFFKIHYITNPGMAFGQQLPGAYGKILLTSFRILAMFAIAWYMRKLYLKKAAKGLQICVALIFGGAIGNLVDSIFYGKFLGLTVDGATTPWLHGKVIDMFYIDIAQGYYPDNWPLVGGDYYNFWPIFNIADAAIFIAVIFILIFQKRYFNEKPQQELN